MINIFHIASYALNNSLYKRLVGSLNKYDIKNTIYCFAPMEALRNKVDAKDIYFRGTHKRRDRYNFCTKHNKTFKDFELFMEGKGKPNIIHAHSLFSNGIIAYYAYRKYNIPYVVAVRNTDINIFFKYFIFLRSTGRKILKNASKIIFISTPYKNYCINKYVNKNDRNALLEKTEVLPNGINELFLKNKSIKSRDDVSKRVRLIYVGRIEKNKNVETTIQACNLLISKGYKVEYTVVGKIVDQKYLKLLDVDFIKHIDTVSQEQLLEIYKENDVFVMPSLLETFGLVYAEAMTQGLPVIYSRGQGFDGMFKEGVVGFSVEAKDSTDIAYKIEQVLLNYDLISKNCNELSDKFNWDNIAEEYYNIYKEIII